MKKWTVVLFLTKIMLCSRPSHTFATTRTAVKQRGQLSFTPFLGRSILHLAKGNTENNKKNLRYEDDCFGLIFLTAAPVVRDAVFAGTFLTLSLAAVVLCRQGIITQTGWLEKNGRRRLPATVAALTLVLTPVITAILSATSLYYSSEISDTGRTGEVVVCAASVLYGLFTSDDHSS
jgi:hypothetical protein